MPFVEPVTIREAVENVHRKKYLLPAIQREFVWSAGQIELLFDSIMRGYPISSFLFWEINKDRAKDYQFYEFVRDYHERDNTHNPKADVGGESEITAILDGQQRLTSLYIGLKGRYAYKLPRKRWDNDQAFPVRRLFLNLLAPSPNPDMEFDFRFLTKAEAKQRSDKVCWFAVGDILDFREPGNVNEWLIDSGLLGGDREVSKFANNSLYKLFQVVNDSKCINFFLEKDDSLDKVLNIFIRVNSGGTKLSYSDLLLSIATAQWKDRDAREEVTGFVDEVNAIGDGFNINKDFVLKSCLVLGGFKDIAFKVDNFNRSNMLAIEKSWDAMADAIRGAYVLLASLGYHRDTLTSNNAVIPIAYYLYKVGSPENFPVAAKYAGERAKIFRWLVIALLKRTFGGHPDNVLRPMREAIDEAAGEAFPYDAMIGKLKGTEKAMSFDDDEIYNLMYNKYGTPYTYSILAFLYPTLDFRNKFHQDHIFPRKLFTKSRLKKRGIEPEKASEFMGAVNYIANLQLLEGTPNQEKSGKEFGEWLAQAYPEKADRRDYMKKNYIPDVDLSLENFDQFIERREELLVDAFRRMLNSGHSAAA